MYPDFQEVTILADSIVNNRHDGSKDRLTTFKLTYWRAIHAEMMTYRVWSRNCSSSRAIPVKKMIANVVDQEVLPAHFGKNQRGMSADSEVDPATKEKAKEIIRSLKHKTVEAAQELLDLGIHKQVVNRYLEPFGTITMIVTSTSWSNFFQQRIHKDAQPDIRLLAEEMLDKISESIPKTLRPGEYHLPFISSEYGDDELTLSDQIVCSIARCARASYLNFDGINSVEDNWVLFKKLYNSEPRHYTPFEHICKAKGDGKLYANLKSFMHYRYAIEHEQVF